MKRSVFTLVLAGLIAGFAFADDVKHPCPINADIWVLAGQSNMQGAGKMREQSKQSPIGGVCPGLFFARHLYANGVDNIGLIPCAHGGTSMNQWDPEKKDLGDESLYGAMLNRIKMTGGNIKGLLWYQGESDAVDPEAYENKMLRFIDAVRKDTEQPELPIILVQINRFYLVKTSEGHKLGWGMTAYCNLIDEADMAVPAFGPLPVLKPVSLNGKTHQAVIGVEQKADYAINWWLPRHEQILKRNKEGKADIIFLGNSITHAWENSGKEVWEKYYEPRNAGNMGFGGDKTQHVLWRIDHGELEGINPRVAVLMIGTNNSWDNTPQETADGVEEICLKIRKKLPDTKILLLGIFPRGEVGDMHRKVNDAANVLIPELAEGNMIHFLNINEHFLKKDGSLGNYFQPDQVHLTEAGYKTWAKAMEPLIAQLMGE